MSFIDTALSLLQAKDFDGLQKELYKLDKGMTYLARKTDALSEAVRDIAATNGRLKADLVRACMDNQALQKQMGTDRQMTQTMITRLNEESQSRMLELESMRAKLRETNGADLG